MPTITRRFALLLALLLSCAGTSAAAQLTLPRGAWRTFDTPHFRVHHTAGLDSLARHAAGRAEAAHARLSAEFLAPPPGRIDLVVADFADAADGAAAGVVARIWVNVHAPAEDRQLGFFDDWLDLVVTHELVHVFHVSTSGGMWRRLGSVFGLSPVTKPNMFSPLWLSEGLAVGYESRLTGLGRLAGSHYDMILRAAALEGSFFTLDRVTADPARWPGHGSGYIYGAYFVDHLVDRYGQERVSDFVRRFGSQAVPLRLDAAARRVFGRSLHQEWDAWSDSLRIHYQAVAATRRAGGLTEPELLTSGGGVASRPRFNPQGNGIVYTAFTGRDPLAVRLIGPDGRERDVARPGTFSAASWLPDASGVLVTRLELSGRHRTVGDLYRLDATGRETRLTRGARLLHADAHPGGREAVAVRGGEGRSALVTVDLATGAVRTLHEAPGTHWSHPRWSPDGERIAAARVRRGGYFDVAVLDAAGGEVRGIAGGRRLTTEPAWSPDGRYLVFSSDRSGISDLYAYDLATDRLWQVTRVLTGAFEPDVSPDGRWIAFSYYRADGYRLARVPFQPSEWTEVEAASDPYAEAEPSPGAFAAAESRPYSLRASGRPLVWTPLPAQLPGLGFGAGFVAGGFDVLGQHSYGVDAAVFRGGRVSAQASYEYAGFPAGEVAASLQNRWSARRIVGVGAEGADTTRVTRLRRDRRAQLELRFLRPRLGSSSSLTVGADVYDAHFTWADEEAAGSGIGLPRLPADVGVRLALGRETVRRYPRSVGDERGGTAWASVQGRHFTAPFPGQERATGYLRLQAGGSTFRGLDLPGFSRHSLGVSLQGAADLGPRSPGFVVGGGASHDVFALRGYAGGQEGDRALRAAAEYRVPLALVERGGRRTPFYLDRVWGTAFAEAGTAWCGGGCGGEVRGALRPAPLPSVGAELTAAVRYLGIFPFTVKGGAALPLADPADGGARKPRFYLGSGL